MKIGALLVALLILAACREAEREGTHLPDSLRAFAESNTPDELRDVFRSLDSLFSPSDRVALRDMPQDSISRYHFSMGMTIRNEHGLWSGGSLQSYFRELGVLHPDDMSGIVLEAYRSYLRGEKIDMPEIIGRQPMAPPPESFKVVKKPR